jgi:RNA polymerase sigma-70 factor (ECF subfamily)
MRHDPQKRYSAPPPARARTHTPEAGAPTRRQDTREAWYAANTAWLRDYFHHRGTSAPEEIFAPSRAAHETAEPSRATAAAPRLLSCDERAELTRWFLDCRETVRRVLLRGGLPLRELDSAVSEVFARAAAEIGRYRREAAPRTWLAGIARRVALEYWGRAANTRELPTESFDLAHDAPDVPARLDRARIEAALRAALVGLPDDQRAVVWMYLYEELTMVRIAEALGVPQATAWGRLRLAYERLTPMASAFVDALRD